MLIIYSGTYYDKLTSMMRSQSFASASEVVVLTRPMISSYAAFPAASLAYLPLVTSFAITFCNELWIRLTLINHVIVHKVFYVRDEGTK
jgi:hypothetical protein